MELRFSNLGNTNSVAGHLSHVHAGRIWSAGCRFPIPGLYYQLHTSPSRSRIGQDPRLSLHARTFCRHVSRESVSYIKVATRLRLNVCWCTSEACKYKKRNHSGGYSDSLLNCSVAWKKRTADLAFTASRFSQERFSSKGWLLFEVGTWNLLKKTFKTCFYLPA